MKPIEPNCRAVIVNSVAGNDGKILTVIGRAPDHDESYIDEQRENVWYVDRPITSSNGATSYTASEYILQRIDDDDVELGSWEELSTIWQPKELVV